jgi:nucleoside-diphosphate-sugar epimerase
VPGRIEPALRVPQNRRRPAIAGRHAPELPSPYLTRLTFLVHLVHIGTGGQRGDQILNAAVGVFGKHGFKKTSVDDLAAAAIGYGHEPQEKPFSETDWTNLNSDVVPYVKSKALAERAAWDFMAKQGGNLEFSVISPVGVFGPVLGPDYSTSILLVQRLMDSAMPGCPRLYFGVVDVRDVADIHLRAMTNPAAKGERFLAVTGDFMSMVEIAKLLKSRLGEAAKRVPTTELPNWLVRLAALRDPTIRLILPELGKYKNATNEKAKRILGWTPRSNEDSILGTAESLIRLGLLQGSQPHSQ